jgi:diadenosine tetraphosphate (Ap4A) HIT family hydrolase
MADCPLCPPSPPDSVLWSDAQARVILVDQSREQHVFPGFCRVIWTAHTQEMSDLNVSERYHLMNLVLDVEQALRAVFQPDKINLASLGNVVPHLHWHIIPRWQDDSHFPDSIWATPPTGKPATNRAIMETRLALVSRIQPELDKQRLKRQAAGTPIC